MIELYEVEAIGPFDRVVEDILDTIEQEVNR